VLVGQVYQADVDGTFAPGSGLDKHFSDYVGRILVSPADYLDLLYRFRLDNDGLDVRRSEIGFTAGPDWLTVTGSYIHLKDDPDAVVETTGERQQFYTTADFELDDEWSFNADWRQDLTGEGTISYGGGLIYENECIIIEAGARRRFYDKRDVTPDTSILFTITLKSLG
jgi:LPS-assembly protein